MCYCKAVYTELISLQTVLNYFFLYLVKYSAVLNNAANIRYKFEKEVRILCYISMLFMMTSFENICKFNFGFV